MEGQCKVKLICKILQASGANRLQYKNVKLQLDKKSNSKNKQYNCKVYIMDYKKQQLF